MLTTHKEEDRRGKVQLVNATGADFPDKGNPFYVKMLRSLGDKRKESGNNFLKLFETNLRASADSSSGGQDGNARNR